MRFLVFASPRSASLIWKINQGEILLCKADFPAAPEHNWSEILLEIGTRENAFIATRRSVVIALFIYSTDYTLGSLR